MYCPACGTELPHDAAFCSECGIRQPRPSYDVQSVYAAVPKPERERLSGIGFRREGPLGRLASLLSLPATLVGLYLVIRLWGENREESFRVLGALALFAWHRCSSGLCFFRCRCCSAYCFGERQTIPVGVWPRLGGLYLRD
ncbi:MAG: zinc ribbon domain-containing protein [Thermomicrobiales bacterium]